MRFYLQSLYIVFIHILYTSYMQTYFDFIYLMFEFCLLISFLASCTNYNLVNGQVSRGEKDQYSNPAREKQKSKS